jgi:hypothetical protein
MRDEFDAHVLDSFRKTCTGVSLILGLNNSRAKFVYFQCIAASKQTESAAIDLFKFLSIKFSISFPSPSACALSQLEKSSLNTPCLRASRGPYETPSLPVAVLLELVQASRDHWQA